jgi:hypothetical protein
VVSAAGQCDGVDDEFGGAVRAFHGKFGEHGAGELVHSVAWLLAFQRARTW